MTASEAPAGADAERDDDAPRLLRICLAAAEAYPALEAEFLGARHQVCASFRIFDPETHLISAAARDVGESWSDLLRHVLDRGVDIDLILADFDAIARPELHALSTRCTRTLRDLAGDTRGRGGRLRVRSAPHPARMGLLPRLALLPVIRKHLTLHCAELNDRPREAQDKALRDVPGLAQHLFRDDQGQLRPHRFALPEILPATHHQKIAVFDRERLYIGGLDLNDRRFDTPGHDRPADQTWHDVQLLVAGPVAAEAHAHLERFLSETDGNAVPRPARHLLRTLSARRRVPLPFIGPRTVADELRQAHVDRLGKAETLIYIETQFFRDLELAGALAERGRQARDLNLIVILPAAPEEVAFDQASGKEMRHAEALQVRCLERLRDAFGPRFFAGAPAQPRPAAAGTSGRDVLFGAPIIYVHAKIAVFDRAAAIVSSANLNGRSLSWDTEAGLALTRPEDVSALRHRCMAHWLGAAIYDADPARFLKAETWRQIALSNAARAPEDRDGFILPFPSAQTRGFAQEVPGFPDKVV